MLATCTQCGHEIVRYDESLFADPCPVCGSVILRVLHLPNGRLPFQDEHVPAHSYLRNVETGERLTADICEPA